MCPETFIVKKYDTNFFQIASSFRRVSGSFEHVLENFQVSKNFLRLFGNLQHVSGINKNIYTNVNIFFLSIICNQKILSCQKISAFVWKFSLYTKMTIFFSFMTQKISGLFKNLRIAMLPCYQCFSVSGSRSYLLVGIKIKWIKILLNFKCSSSNVVLIHNGFRSVCKKCLVKDPVLEKFARGLTQTTQWVFKSSSCI